MLSDSKLQHIIAAVVYIALNAKPNAVRGPEICKAQNLPERYLESDLQQLVHYGILRSVRGPKGGYVLAKERRNITLADIYKGIGVENAETIKNGITDALKRAEDKYSEELSKTTVEQLCAQTSQSDAQKQKPDFTI